MRMFVAVLALGYGAVAAVLAQQPDASTLKTYAGYAVADCTPAKTPALRIVLPASAAPLPPGVPTPPPRPAIELLVNAAVDRAVGQRLQVAPNLPTAGEPAAQALSCPIVGDCSRAQSGDLTMKRRAEDGAITGEFAILWPDEAARQTVVRGRFVAAWRDASASCG